MSRLLAACLIAVSFCGCRRPRPVYGALPDFTLTAVSAGRPAAPLRRQDLLGRVWIADFIYTTCSGPCPALSAEMERLQKELPDRVGLLSFTVDPEHDDAAVLAAYAKRFGARPARWLFVTGPKDALSRLLLKGFLVSGGMTHSTRLVLLDSRARLRGYFDGLDPASRAALRKAAESLD
ncbi:MAG: SCO family protein [Elusimicrobia bacterium]|nr:SCO family protein [Elusimicrobiota bacterium]MDE2236525.1 SCO family protein [Elusimicrobiota bacterium]MDE2425823.1 SCO family protein [Elusimicrobiota bacterium]